MNDEWWRMNDDGDDYEGDEDDEDADHDDEDADDDEDDGGDDDDDDEYHHWYETEYWRAQPRQNIDPRNQAMPLLLTFVATIEGLWATVCGW